LTEENKKNPGESRYSISDIIEILKISRATYYRYLEFAKELIAKAPVTRCRKRLSN
jgi:hypothetical protein